MKGVIVLKHYKNCDKQTKEEKEEKEEKKNKGQTGLMARVKESNG